jgi:hypothetical protein
VDDGSTDGSAQSRSAFPETLPLRALCHDRNRGRAAARNTGIREAAGPVVLFLDDDMEAEPGLLARHLEAHAGAAPTAAIGRIVSDGLDPKIPFHAFLLREDEWRRERLRKAATVGFGEMTTGQLSVGREAALKAGLFDEQIGRYGLEDIEFAYRLVAGRRAVRLSRRGGDPARGLRGGSRSLLRAPPDGGGGRLVPRAPSRYSGDARVPADGPGPGGGTASLFTWLMAGSAAVLRKAGRGRVAGFSHASEGPARRHPSARTRGARRPLGFAYNLMRDIQYFAAMDRRTAARPLLRRPLVTDGGAAAGRTASMRRALVIYDPSQAGITASVRGFHFEQPMKDRALADGLPAVHPRLAARRAPALARVRHRPARAPLRPRLPAEGAGAVPRSGA